MSAETVAELQDLLAQWQKLNLQDPPPELDDQLAAAVSTAKAQIRRHSKKLGQEENSTRDGRHGPLENPQPQLFITNSNLRPSEVPQPSPIKDSAPAVDSPTPATPSQFPFIEIDLHGERPSRTAYVNPDGMRQFGMPLKGVFPREPPLDLFVWRPEDMSQAGKPEADKLVPAPAAPKPEVGCYPQAPEYVLNSELDRSYRRGWRYAAPYLTSHEAHERENMYDIRMPPKVAPTQFDVHACKFVAEPIPGMVKLPLGIPLVHHVNGDPKRPVTIVCAHSLDTVLQYKEGPQIHALIPRLMELTWGREKSDIDPGVPTIFALPGMQTNLRSKHVSAAVEGDGSYNLASTHGEGEGRGHFAPAVQTDVPPAGDIIKEVLQILHQLYRLIMPLCISHFEWDLMEFHGYENNVLAFGGLEPGPTSCQHNVSSPANVFDIDLNGLKASEPSPSSEEPQPSWIIDLEAFLRDVFRKSAGLDTAIGPQGSPHGDPQDDAFWHTLFAVTFRLPQGSDPGAFLWMRGAIYL
ncbi:hypothetical protein DFH08DRAFT_815631 [Mycena albidolilacea]|uniref:Uncharacterized protein n=1 Tax=Mycena albidolilacea TaxID=1033008 RepID=A0AAD7EIZ3_9AGAR|nr:hypothetical protein DFH08DRAFT_815631 [Mycena albidolilacea]